MSEREPSFSEIQATYAESHEQNQVRHKKNSKGMVNRALSSKTGRRVLGATAAFTGLGVVSAAAGELGDVIDRIEKPAIAKENVKQPYGDPNMTAAEVAEDLATPDSSEVASTPEGYQPNGNAE